MLALGFKAGSAESEAIVIVKATPCLRRTTSGCARMWCCVAPNAAALVPGEWLSERRCGSQ